MSMRLLSSSLGRTLGLAVALAPLGLVACSDAGSTPSGATAEVLAQERADAEARLAPWQRELLELSFAAASDFPENPHHKDRGRAQEVVVQACLDLDAPDVALDYNRRVSNWRKGSGYADTAFYLLRNELGSADEIADLLAEARRIAPTGREWRRDRVLAKVAKCYAYEGKDLLLADTAGTIAPVEASRVTIAFAMRADASECRNIIEGVTAIASTAGFEELRESLEACIELHGRFYADEELRGAIEDTVLSNLDKVPLDLRIGLLYSLADSELEHANTEHALELLDQARALRLTAKWPAEFGVPLLAGEAARRYIAGQEERALAGFAEAKTLYRVEVDAGILLDFFRREALVPMAEAYALAGLRDDALATYRLAVQELSKNPNARPRTEDLVATCCSMAVQGIEPDEELLDAIRATRASIAEAWQRRVAQLTR